MASVESNGISMEYETIGSGEPLLLIMGLGAQMIAWPEEFCAARTPLRPSLARPSWRSKAWATTSRRSSGP